MIVVQSFFVFLLCCREEVMRWQRFRVSERADGDGCAVQGRTSGVTLHYYCDQVGFGIGETPAAWQFLGQCRPLASGAQQ